MTATTIPLLNFVAGNWLIIFLALFSLLRIVPSRWIQNEQLAKQDPLMTPLTAILSSFSESIIKSFFPLFAGFGFINRTVPVIIFVVVVFDVFVKQTISNQAVTLIAVGIVALYMEKLIDTGKKISFFGIVAWERKDEPTVLPSGS